MLKRLILGVIVSGIGLSVCNYFKFDTFMIFMTGSTSYVIYDILTDIKIKAKQS